MTDLCILGGGPAAWSCAMTARARSLETLVIHTGISQSVLSRAEKIVNYPGIPEISGLDLLASFRDQALAMGCQERVVNARQVMAMEDSVMVLCGQDVVECRALVLALGAARPALLPGEEDLLGRGVSWCGTCDGIFYRGKEVAVLSAWEGGVEEAVFLADLCSGVDYYVMKEHEHSLPDSVHEKAGRPQSLEKEGDRIRLHTKESSALYDGVFIFRPAVSPTRLLPDLETEDGFIRVNRRMETSIPRVFACGDCTGRPLQIAKAVGEGNVAAISASELLQQKKG